MCCDVKCICIMCGKEYWQGDIVLHKDSFIKCNDCRYKCGHQMSLESLPPQEYICSLERGHEGNHKDQYKSNYEWV